MGGSHMSFSDRTRIMDVVGHKVLWVSPVNGAKPERVYEFPDSDAGIDYPRLVSGREMGDVRPLPSTGVATSGL
jgi:hypothetical protein